MSISWVWLLGASTFTLLSEIINDEPYYFDSTFLYFLAFTIAPLSLNSYLNSLSKVDNCNLKNYIFLKFNLVILCLFNLILVILSFSFTLAFYETFKNKELSSDWLLISIPIALSVSVVCLSQFLYRTSLKK